MFDQVDAAPRHPPQQRVQARRQLAQVERLEQVIVGARLQAVDTVGHRVPCGQDQHRDFQALLAQLLEQLEAVFIGQAEVQHHDVERRHADHRPRRRCRGDVLDGQALSREPGNDAAGNQLIVFADQYVHGKPQGKK